MGVKIGAAYCA